MEGCPVVLWLTIWHPSVRLSRPLTPHRWEVDRLRVSDVSILRVLKSVSFVFHVYTSHSVSVPREFCVMCDFLEPGFISIWVAGDDRKVIRPILLLSNGGTGIRELTRGLATLPPKIVMHNAFNVIFWTSANICVVPDDLGWKNRTTRYNCRFAGTSLALRVIFLGGTTKQRIIIAGFGELAAVD